MTKFMVVQEHAEEPILELEPMASTKFVLPQDKTKYHIIHFNVLIETDNETIAWHESAIQLLRMANYKLKHDHSRISHFADMLPDVFEENMRDDNYLGEACGIAFCLASAWGQITQIDPSAKFRHVVFCKERDKQNCWRFLVVTETANKLKGWLFKHWYVYKDYGRRQECIGHVRLKDQGMISLNDGLSFIGQQGSATLEVEEQSYGLRVYMRENPLITLADVERLETVRVCQ